MTLVRDATGNDVAAIAALLAELGYPVSAAEIPARLAAVAAAPGRVFVAEQGEEVIGVASVTCLTLLHRPKPSALLSALIVRAEYRGQGVGRLLVEAAARQAAAWNCSALELTSRDDRWSAHRFYTGLGFESPSRKFVRALDRD